MVLEQLLAPFGGSVGSWRRTLVCNMPLHMYFWFRVKYSEGHWNEWRHLLVEGSTLFECLEILVEEMKFKAWYETGKFGLVERRDSREGVLTSGSMSPGTTNW